MKNAYLFLFCFLTNALFSAQLSVLEDSKVNGNPQSVIVKSQGRYFTEGKGGKMIPWQTMFYDSDDIYYKNGKPQKIFSYNLNGLRSLNRVFVYDNENKIIREELYNEDGDLTSTSNYFYKNNDLFKIQTSDTKHYNLFNAVSGKPEYDDIERISEIKYITEFDDSRKFKKTSSIIDKKVKEEKVEYYNSEGKNIRTITNEFGEFPSRTTENFIYEGSLLISSTFDNELVNIETRFDEYGNPIYNKNVPKLDGMTSVITIKYEYDANKNWIKRSKYDEGVEFRVTTRKISY
jgi:hypothetical protein